MSRIKQLVEILMVRFPMIISAILCILKPHRLVYRLKKGRLFYRVSRSRSSNKKGDSHIIDASSGVDIDEAVNILLKHGTLVLQDYFDKDAILLFKQEFEKFISYPSSDIASSTGDTLPLTQELVSMWRDKKIVKIIEGAIRREVYGRDYPRFTMVYPRYNLDGTVQYKKTASEFHVDHVSLISAGVYFSDVTSKTSRMQVLSGSHRYLIYPLRFSEKVQNAFLNRFELLDCIGGIGSVQIHLGDVLHRFMPVGDSSRLWVKFDFSDGINILFDPWLMASSLPPGLDKSSFIESTKDRFFDGLYPKMPYKGYKLQGRKIYPSNDNNI